LPRVHRVAQLGTHIQVTLQTLRVSSGRGKRTQTREQYGLQGRPEKGLDTHKEERAPCMKGTGDSPLERGV
jgi:hypothetical protein